MNQVWLSKSARCPVCNEALQITRTKELHGPVQLNQMSRAMEASINGVNARSNRYRQGILSRIDVNQLDRGVSDGHRNLSDRRIGLRRLLRLRGSTNNNDSHDNPATANNTTTAPITVTDDTANSHSGSAETRSYDGESCANEREDQRQAQSQAQQPQTDVNVASNASRSEPVLCMS